MVVAVQQLLAEYFATSTVRIAEHHPPPCAVTIHKTCTDQQWNGFQDSARQDQKVDVLANTEHFEVPKYSTPALGGTATQPLFKSESADCCFVYISIVVYTKLL